MNGITNTRGLSILCAALLLGPLGRARASDDPWPLVNAADLAVWGTLVHSQTGPASRLLVVASEGTTDGEGSAPVRLVDHVVGLPDGTFVPPRGRGLFLATTADGRDPGFPEVAGTVLAAGFVPGWPDAATRERVASLVGGAGTAPADAEDAALALLSADWAPARAIAIGWWRERAETASPAAREGLARLAAGDDPAVERLALELHLLRGWPVATRGLASRLVAAEDEVLADLLLRAIAASADPTPRAELLLAWPAAGATGRARLLGAYAELSLEESLPWWREAFASDDAELTTIAIREIGRADIPGATDVYRALLASDDDRLVSLALEGLAIAGTPAAFEMLREFRDDRAEEDPLAGKAERLLRQPRRYAARPPGPSPLADEGR